MTVSRWVLFSSLRGRPVFVLNPPVIVGWRVNLKVGYRYRQLVNGLQSLFGPAAS